VSGALADLLALTPKCQITRCHAWADVRLILQHPNWRSDQRANLCARHQPDFTARAQAIGATVSVEHQWRAVK
jgi:hypothetical protein